MRVIYSEILIYLFSLLRAWNRKLFQATFSILFCSDPRSESFGLKISDWLAMKSWFSFIRFGSLGFIRIRNLIRFIRIKSFGLYGIDFKLIYIQWYIFKKWDLFQNFNQSFCLQQIIISSSIFSSLLTIWFSLKRKFIQTQKKFILTKPFC